MRRAAVLLALLALPAFAASIDNNDTCDIAVTPAATLLLPYFEVDFQHPRSAATQTLFTIVNVSPRTHVANVTLWTDYGYPALSFSVVLRGHGMETIDLYDVFTRGAMPSCSGPVPPAMLADLQSMFTKGRTSGCAQQVGDVHELAVGYATIDVVAKCTTENPSSSDYYAGTILFDNVLTGDYERINADSDGRWALGGALVHVRAIPEGGAAGAVVETNLPYTFYDRFTASSASRKIDRRQPLPSVFAARLIDGGPNALRTSIAIWREATGDGSCASFLRTSPYFTPGHDLQIAETIRFDEHENATIFGGCITLCPPALTTTAAAAHPANSGWFPSASTSGDVGGWLYLNLHDLQRKRPTQNWVTSSMRMGASYAVDLRPAPLGNGCSPIAPYSSNFGAVIGPAPNPTP